MQIPVNELRNLVKVTDFPLLRELCDNCKNSYDNHTRFVISFYDSRDRKLSFITIMSGEKYSMWGVVSINTPVNWGISNENLFDTIYEALVVLPHYSPYEIKALDSREWFTYLNKITSKI